MSFLYLYDLIDFDEKGSLKATGVCENIKSVESNYLYLVAKYNQNILKNDSVKNGDVAIIPAFFKEDLSTLLKQVENGEITKDAALETISNFSCDKVKCIVETRKNDKDLIMKLSALVNVEAEDYAKNFKKAVNKNQLGYIMTTIAGNLMTEISSSLAEAETDKKAKSNIYKKIISYNGIMNAADNLENIYEQVVAR